MDREEKLLETDKKCNEGLDNMDNIDNTPTTQEQIKTENIIKEIFAKYKFKTQDSENYKDYEQEDGNLIYNCEMHFNLAKKLMKKLPTGYQGFDSGMPWFAYWVLNIIYLSGKNNIEISHEMKLDFVQYLKELQSPEGGFCGYSKGVPHLISNYSAVMTIVLLGIKEGYDIINLPKMKNFLKKMKNDNFLDSGKLIL